MNQLVLVERTPEAKYATDPLMLIRQVCPGPSRSPYFVARADWKLSKVVCILSYDCITLSDEMSLSPAHSPAVSTAQGDPPRRKRIRLSLACNQVRVF